MCRIIAVHSFRRGTGKSTLIANLGTLLAAAGQRVGVVDTNVRSPSLHILFDLDEAAVAHALNAYLWGEAGLRQIVYDVTPGLKAPAPGRLWLIPASARFLDITRTLRQGYQPARLGNCFDEFIDAMNLDVLLIDTQAGLNEESLLTFAVASTLLLILRPDRQDYQGTGMMLDVGRRLEVPRILLVVNEAPALYDYNEVKLEVTDAYTCPVAAVIPHFEELTAVADNRLFVQRRPEHPLTAILTQLLSTL